MYPRIIHFVKEILNIMSRNIPIWSLHGIADLEWILMEGLQTEFCLGLVQGADNNKL